MQTLRDLDPIHPLDRARWSHDAMAEATVICGRWALDLRAVVGASDVPRDGLGTAALHRIGALIGLDRSLLVVVGVDQGLAWLHAPNAGGAFAGMSPAAMMEKGGLRGPLLVRGVLDAMRVGLFPMHDDAEPVRLAVVS